MSRRRCCCESKCCDDGKHQAIVYEVYFERSGFGVFRKVSFESRDIFSDPPDTEEITTVLEIDLSPWNGTWPAILVGPEPADGKTLRDVLNELDPCSNPTYCQQKQSGAWRWDIVEATEVPPVTGTSVRTTRLQSDGSETITNDTFVLNAQTGYIDMAAGNPLTFPSGGPNNPNPCSQSDTREDYRNKVDCIGRGGGESYEDPCAGHDDRWFVDQPFDGPGGSPLDLPYISPVFICIDPCDRCETWQLGYTWDYGPCLVGLKGVTNWEESEGWNVTERLVAKVKWCEAPVE